MASEAFEKVMADIAAGHPTVLDGVTDGPHTECPCEVHTARRALAAARYWLAPGQIYVPPGGVMTAGISPFGDE